MTICRKSFMPECEYLPECEYFTTGGCVSPFNCPYKVENESITTATSTPRNLYPLETDKDKEIARLTAENAELRAKLEKAVELPLVQTIRGNKLPYEVVYKDGNGRIIVTKYRRWQKKQAEARFKELQGGER